MHDETHKQITICNDNYKFVAYPYSILQEFTVKNVVMIMIHSEKYSLRTVSQSHSRTYPMRVLRMITSITDELDFHRTMYQFDFQ